MIEKMKTECVGRYLIDVPIHAEVSWSDERIAGFAIDTLEESEAEFRQRVGSREADIAARGSARDGTGGLVQARDLRIPGLIGRTLIYGLNRGYLMDGSRRIEDEYVSVEAHAHLGGLSFSLTAKYADESRATLAEALLAHLQLRDENEIPAADGFCVSRAIFTEPLPVRKAEHAVVHVGLPGHPDLAVTLVSMPGGGSEPNLIARSAQTDAGTDTDVLSRISRLREGKRNINGIGGEELLVRAREYNLTTTYGLNWESRGIENDPLQSYILLELQTGLNEGTDGKAVDTSLHEDALLALWDGISSSIRLRRNDPPATAMPASEPSAPDLGVIAYAGEVCRQSGWWACESGKSNLDVRGGQVQMLRKGDKMPQALLLPRQTLWQKVRGLRPSLETADTTAWKLVDKRQCARPTELPALAPAIKPVLNVTSSSNRAHAIPVGSFARTGESCPVSGWWRCEESQALDGTRWFARDSLLPAATFQVAAGVFARAGGPEFIQRRSSWQLVRQADSDGFPETSPAAD